MTRLKFFREGLKNIKTVGTVTRSSRFMCREIVKNVNWEGLKCIVELGAGDGVITKYLLKRLPKDAKLFAFEVNHEFCNELREIGDNRLIVVEDSACKIQEVLNRNGFDNADCIVSALPFTNFTEKDTEEIVSKSYDLLKEGGLFLQVHYSLKMKSLYKKYFGELNIRFIPFNIPPAYLVVAEKD